MNRYLRCIVIIISIAGWDIEKVHAYQDEVDWMWNDVKSTVRQGPACMNFIVKAFPIQMYRGRVSGHTCLEKAIASYRKGDHEEAVGWILAGQCHDRLAREILVKHAPHVLEYVVQRYGDQVP